MPEDVPEEVPDDEPDDVPEAPEGSPDDAPDDAPEEVPDEVPEEVPDDDEPEEVPDELEEVPEDAPEEVPDDPVVASTPVPSPPADASVSSRDSMPAASSHPASHAHPRSNAATRATFIRTPQPPTYRNFSRVWGLPGRGSQASPTPLCGTVFVGVFQVESSPSAVRPGYWMNLMSFREKSHRPALNFDVK